MKHFFRMAAVTAFLILCTVLPFLPGRYDAMAVPLSLMAQLFGKVGLILVPIGAVWMAARSRGSHAFAITALIAGSLVWIAIALAGMTESLSLGMAALALWLYALVRLIPRLKTVKSAAVPLALIVVPASVALIQLAIAEPITRFSRERAIRNSAPLIEDIERYRVANGRYPKSLIALWDYSPSVIGIMAYQYEPHGEAYNVLFEQPSLQLGVREIVMYNPLDQQVMTSHGRDVLQLTPEQLAVEHMRGHNAVHDGPRPHWKYFWFD